MISINDFHLMGFFRYITRKANRRKKIYEHQPTCTIDRRVAYIRPQRRSPSVARKIGEAVINMSIGEPKNKTPITAVLSSAAKLTAVM
jgi:hypothetical protein